MRNYPVVLALLVALASSVWAIGIDVWGLRTQPDGTTFEAHVFGTNLRVTSSPRMAMNSFMVAVARTVA